MYVVTFYAMLVHEFIHCGKKYKFYCKVTMNVAMPQISHINSAINFQSYHQVLPEHSDKIPCHNYGTYSFAIDRVKQTGVAGCSFGRHPSPPPFPRINF